MEADADCIQADAEAAAATKESARKTGLEVERGEERERVARRV